MHGRLSIRFSDTRWQVVFSGLICSVGLLVLSAGVTAAEDARYRVIRELGELNGIALQCRYIDQVRRMKAAVVLNAPKERSFGLAFDEATNRSFLAFIEEKAVCPHPETFERQVGHQVDALRAAFSTH